MAHPGVREFPDLLCVTHQRCSIVASCTPRKTRGNCLASMGRDRLRVATSRTVSSADKQKPKAWSNFPQIVQTADSGAPLPLHRAALMHRLIPWECE